MALIVQKFGGTSLANIDCIKNAAYKVLEEINLGNKVVVVVSAMAGITDQLINYTKQISEFNDQKELAEYDVVISSGEQVTSGLLSLYLISLGKKSRSWLGWQLSLKTDNSHSKALIEDVDTYNLLKSIEKGEIPVISGFQGVNNENRITTLGRGGSDTSAVAIAAALKADRCDIYTDVEGVYTSDPKIVEKAKKLDKISYEEMLEMSALGAKVLQTRSVKIAMKYGIPIMVSSSFSNISGTLVTEENQYMEKKIITGIAYSKNEARITLCRIPNIIGIQSKIFEPIAKENFNIDMIVQNFNESEDEAYITFSLEKKDLKSIVEIIKHNQKEIGYQFMKIDEDMVKISLIGLGIKTNFNVAQKIFNTLAEHKIKIFAIATSEIKISVLILSQYLDLAAKSLHSAFDLDL